MARRKQSSILGSLVASDQKAKGGKTNNFQKGTNGREAGTKTFTFKSRTKDGKTLAYNARCNASRDTEGCAVARDLFKKVQRSMAEVPDDNDKIRKIKRKS